MRFFTEFTLSQKTRPFPFGSLRVRVTYGEGFRQTWHFPHCDTVSYGERAGVMGAFVLVLKTTVEEIWFQKIFLFTINFPLF